MIKIAGISCPLDAEPYCRGGVVYTSGPLLDALAAHVGVAASNIKQAEVVRRSVDARRKGNVHFVVNVAASLDAQTQERLVACGKATPYVPYAPLEVPRVATCGAALAAQHPKTDQLAAGFPAKQPLAAVPPVVVGTGPAGLFAALYLARAGACPVVVERGSSVDERARAVARLEEAGTLDPQCNVQFGEGGAGTFSDGKLTTNTKHAMAPHVLHWFAEAGAPPEILWDAKPHIGSDLLPGVVAALRNQIIACGGQVLFDTQLTDMRFVHGSLAEIELTSTKTGEVARRACSRLVLACGHSARDTFALVQEKGLCLEQKPFSMGVRIEHPQAAINQAQWAAAASNPALGAADYKLAVHPEGGRSVYTFCMCPGGEIMCAASEEGRLATNGASPFARDGRFANAAVLANVYPTDFGSADPLAGVQLQRAVEERAYSVARDAGGAPYQAPAQTVGAFLAGRVDEVLPETTYARGVVAADLHDVLPPFVCDALEAGLVQMGTMLEGFDNPQALLIAPETRSSSPVRICRTEGLQAWLDDGAGTNPASVQGCGVYPAGEGAGYAGGIMSAACDGLRVAVQLASEGADHVVHARGTYTPQGPDAVAAPPETGTAVPLARVSQAAEQLRAGKLVAFPTDTVWGVGVAVAYAAAPQAIYAAKGRDANKPVAWLVGGVDALDVYGAQVPDYARNLAHAFWPGALTLVVKASDAVPAAYRCAEGTIGLRMPAHPQVLDLIGRVGAIATSSANVSGAADVASARDLDPAVVGAVACVLDDTARGTSATGQASTVVDCTGPAPRILRQGSVSF